MGGMAVSATLPDRMGIMANAAVHLAARELPKFIILSLGMAGSTILRIRGDLKYRLKRPCGMLVE